MSQEMSSNVYAFDYTINLALYYFNINSAGSRAIELTTSQVFRDPSAWYNIHAVWDSANGTAGDRMRLYVNGTRLTAFHATSQYPQLNGDFGLFNYTVNLEG